MEIKIVGTGCDKCSKLYDNAIQAVNELSIEATVTKVEDLKEMLMLGVMQTPAIMVDGKLKAAGQVVTADKIKSFLK